MPDVVQRRSMFQSRVFQEVTAAEGFVNTDVDVLVDGGGNDKAPEAAYNTASR